MVGIVVIKSWVIQHRKRPFVPTFYPIYSIPIACINFICIAPRALLIQVGIQMPLKCCYSSSTIISSGSSFQNPIPLLWKIITHQMLFELSPSDLKYMPFSFRHLCHWKQTQQTSTCLCLSHIPLTCHFLASFAPGKINPAYPFSPYNLGKSINWGNTLIFCEPPLEYSHRSFRMVTKTRCRTPNVS